MWYFIIGCLFNLYVYWNYILYTIEHKDYCRWILNLEIQFPIRNKLDWATAIVLDLAMFPVRALLWPIVLKSLIVIFVNRHRNK